MPPSAPAPRDLAPAAAPSTATASVTEPAHPAPATTPDPARRASIGAGIVGAVTLVVATVVLATVLGMLSLRDMWADSWIERTPEWWASLVAVTPWLVRVVLWYAVCWAAARARATGRTVALPGAVAASWVAAVSVGAFVWPSVLAFAWIGPAPPLLLTDDMAIRLTVSRPEVGFPVLAAAGLVVASWLGARSGRRRAVDRWQRPTPAAVAATVLAPGVLVLAAGVGAAFAWWAGSDDMTLTTADRVSALVVELLLGLVAAVIGAALLSGCGTAGTLVAILLAIAGSVAPAAGWWAGGDDSQLVVAVCSVLAIALAATWRPAASWLDDLLDPLRRG